MTTPQLRLREIRDEAQKIAAKGILSADESQTFETLMAEAEGLKSQVAQLDRFNGLNDWMGQSAGRVEVAGSTPAGETIIETTPGKDGGIKARLVEQYGEGITSNKALMATTTPAYKSALRTYLRYGDRGLDSAAIKTLQEGQDTEGGFLISPDVLSTLIAKEPTPTRLAARTTMLNTSKDTLMVPRVNYSTATDDPNGFIYSTGIRATATGELPASSTAARITDPIFGQTRIPVHTFMLSAPLSVDMLEDSSFDVLSWLGGRISNTIDLLKDNKVLNGTGRGEPSGILYNPGLDTNQPAVVNLGNPITADKLITLGFSLPEQYDNNAAFVFSKTQTGPVIGLLKDTTNRYLWGAGLQDSGLSPDIKNRKLLGYDCVMSEFAPAPAANAYPIIFGDFHGYYLINRIGVSVRVLNEIYAETNMVLVLARVRFGGAVVEPWRLFCGKQA